MEPATDLKMLVNKGYSEQQARAALKCAEGDVRQASLILRDGLTRDTSWLHKTQDEWVDNVPTVALPANAESRALWKSPVYVRVGSWSRGREEDGGNAEKVQYIVTVIMRDARQWTLRRSFSEFYSLWSCLPYAVSSSLKNGFPHSSIFQFLSLSDEKVEQRRLRLEDWLRDLCFSETCMTDKKVIGPLYKFLDEESHRAAAASISPVRTPFIADASGPPTRHYLRLRNLTLATSTATITLAALTKQLPCKTTVYAALAGNRDLVSACGSGRDSSDAQLARDVERDRVVINGKRLLGSNGGLPAVLCVAMETAQQARLSVGLPPSPRDQLEALCKSALRLASRTVSAFIAHSALSLLIDSKTHPGVLVVPESALADALVLHFSVEPGAAAGASGAGASGAGAGAGAASGPRYLPGSGSTVIPTKLLASKAAGSSGPGAGLVCDISAATVFRVTDGETMETLLQLKVTFVLPLLEAIPSDPYESAYLVLERETSTTNRDWAGDQTL